MKYKRKLLVTCILLAVFTFSQVFTGSAQAETIHETSDKQTITQGVTQENIVRFTTKGWLNINILRIDLTNPYLKVDALTNTTSVNKLSSVKTLASSNNALAAVNASFFTPTGSSQGVALGPVVQSEKVMETGSTFNLYGDVMGSFALSKMNEALFGYWKSSISLTAPNGTVKAVAQYNKPSSTSYTDFTIIDGKWMKTSFGVSESMPDIVEMLVVDGFVAGIYTAQPAVQIPDNGYVVVTRKAGGDFLTQNYKVGDPVLLNMSTTPDWNNIKMSVSGGAMLVKDGSVPAAFSYNVDYIMKSQPRTAVGSTQDGKQLILVTVDGRQNSSIGMTQKEIADYMLSLGAFNALNLDGGGSTTMVARKPGTSQLEIVNSPSDGISRGVATGIGIFSTAPQAPLAGLIIDTDDINAFVNTSRVLSVRGYDQYNNPVAVDPSTVKWSASGIKGSFTGSTFHPLEVGEAKITAAVGDIKASRTISSLSSPVQIILDKSSMKLPVGQSSSLTVTGLNKNGYSASINPADIKWSVKGSSGTVEAGKFTAKARGTGYIDALLGTAHAYCAVSVSADVSVSKDGFEKAGGSFVSYPESVKGSYSISKEQQHSGKTSGKLAYNFSAEIEGTRAAYYVLSNGGLALDSTTSKIGLWVYNDHENSNWLRGEVVDSKGAKHIVEFSRNLTWNGWNQVFASLEDISSPAKLTRIYLAQVNPVDESGAIYIDDLSATISGYPAIDLTKIPKNTVPVDDAKKDVKFTKTADSFRFAVYGQAAEPKNALEKLLMQKLAAKTDALLDAAVIVGKSTHKSFTGNIKSKKPIITSSAYSSTDIGNSRFFNLDASDGGLRVSNSGQWLKFLADLNSFKGANVFVFLPSSPDTFKDQLEAKLLKDTLSDYRINSKKNVWVIYNGKANESTMYRGVKYISSMGYAVDGLKPNNTSKAPYLLITVKGTTVTFNFKSII